MKLDEDGGAKCGLIFLDEHGEVRTKSTAQVGDVIHITNTIKEKNRDTGGPRRLLGMKFRKGKVKVAGRTNTMKIDDVDLSDHPYQFVHVAVVDDKTLNQWVSSAFELADEHPAGAAGSSLDAPIVASPVPPIVAKPCALVHMKLSVENACVRVHLSIRNLRKATTHPRPQPQTTLEEKVSLQANKALAKANRAMSFG